MSAVKRASAGSRAVASPVAAASAPSLAGLHDEELWETAQRQTFNFFWDGAHPLTGVALKVR